MNDDIYEAFASAAQENYTTKKGDTDKKQGGRLFNFTGAPKEEKEPEIDLESVP